MNRRAAATALLVAATTLSASACGTDSKSASSNGSKIEVVASFYPLQHIVEKVGGTHVTVTNLTKPGVEPHDLELTPQDIAKVTSAKLAVYEKGLQPAVDKALKEQNAKNAYDITKDVDLTLKATSDGHDHGDHKDHDHETPTVSPHKDDHKDDEKDPHFWLDPVRYTKAVRAVATKLGEIDAANKADYEKNAEAFTKELASLDTDFAEGLKTCSNKKLVTSHAAFGYLAERYKLQQMSIAGISPDKEPDAARMAKITDFVKDNKVGTIYTETLVSPAVAQTIAKETGAQTAVLDPIEGINDKSAGKNYIEVMRANLATLKKGQSCS
ncbi:metal ABC transporter substrate-binding protein [Austwickia chelonae]|uniref:metal ABC transporter substrate-binding protein n=1 Tax=Austwickia chelonae TaxID=100225 RepID=UPI000E230A3E|nr:metal ABC transporter substrate-binding protein [Austwickia chelonae]